MIAEQHYQERYEDMQFFSGGKYFGDIKRTGIFGVREEKLAITGSELETKEAVKKVNHFLFAAKN